MSVKNTANGNVIPLRGTPPPDTDDDEPDAKDIPGMPATTLLKGCEAKTLETVTRLVRRMLDRADDLLFELADKGQGVESPETYLDGMREVRRKREQVERAVGARLRTTFKAFLANAPAVQDSGEALQLSLVDEEELEESLAVDTMVAKAVDRFATDLTDLARRIAHLSGEEDLTPEALPCGPPSIGTALQAAVTGLDVDMRVRLIVYKLFDKYVIGELGSFYQEMNQELADAGVMPDLRPRARKRQEGQRAAGEAQGGEEGWQDSPQALFDALRELVALQRERGAGEPAGPGSTGSGTAGGAMAGPVLPPDEVVGALSTLQGELPEGTAGGPGVADLKPMLLQRIGGGGAEAQMRQADEDVIDMVGLLFEFILGDQNLPIPVKAALGRLQIPMIKVALLDKAFFTHRNHAARKLLNELAHAGLGVADASAKRDAVFAEIERVVHRVLEEFEDDTRLFETLLEEFTHFLADRDQRTEQVEQREAKSIEGRERLELAKRRVAGAIAERLRRRRVPRGLREFLDEKWRHHLLITYLKVGEEGEEYQDALRIMDGLLWSVRPKKSAQDRQEMVETLRPLLKRLRDALAETFMDPEVHRAAFFRELQAYQLAALRGTDPAADEPERVAEPAAEAQPPFVPEVPSPPPPADALTPPSAEPSPEPAVTAAPAVVDEDALERAGTIPVGTWLELKREGAQAVRVKLSWRSPLTGRCLLVNHRGLKEAEVSAQDLAAQLAGGGLKVLADAPLVDRALSALVEEMREGQGEAPPAG
jgi:hypothetical protein